MVVAVAPSDQHPAESPLDVEANYVVGQNIQPLRLAALRNATWICSSSVQVSGLDLIDDPQTQGKHTRFAVSAPFCVTFTAHGCGPRSAVVVMDYQPPSSPILTLALPVSGFGPACPTLTPTGTATPTTTPTLLSSC